MNERVMQFRIGMFVIVAGLVLTMLIVWFGESPSLFREHGFVKVRYTEAPGVAEGISVRKSGIRIGEVVSIDLDDRPGMPDSVIVILSLDPKYKIKKDSVARITRSLIGDVAIDMLPGSSQEIIAMGQTPATAPELIGDTTPDPAKALAAATSAFERVGGTLQAIEEAAAGFAVVAKKAEKLDEFIGTITETGRNISTAAKGIDRMIADNEADLRPAITNLRQVSEKLGATFDNETTARIKDITVRLSSVSNKLDAGLTEIQPVLDDLGSPAGRANPTTDLGQSMASLNRISANISLLTAGLSDGRGRLNPHGSIQRLVTSPELYDSLARAAAAANDVFTLARPAIRSLSVFADKIARDPSAISKGALLRQ
ncbi:MlaD family protein [Tundrisphaera lichenicola]|uniref:MlaD family protein n=1 Tax=Tundrisphaera lichenicola TaxID=2029860 RepID=UPI003EBF54F3